ncbi:MAG: hypothetical protein AAF701_01830, partial [Pseudomonadota bacterium]
PYQSFSTYLQALRSGRGVGIGLAPLFAADIAAGLLKPASDRCVWRNRAVYVGVFKDSPHPDHARACADIIKKAFVPR